MGDFRRALTLSIKETLINEIHLLPRNYTLVINIKNKELTCILNDFHEDQISLNSLEGISVLDKWFYKWTELIRTLKVKTNNITVDLSGGMDSRLILALLLGSNVNMNEINVHSLNDKLHTHEEDFQIASLIAEHYKFKLNNSNFDLYRHAFSPLEIMNISCYTKLGFHKEMYWKNTYNENAVYYFTGGGGETRRKYWEMEPQKFIEKLTYKAAQFYDPSIKKSTEEIINQSFHDIRSMKSFSSLENEMIPERLYIEARCRQHFGRAAVEDFLANRIIESPFLDVDLRSIDLRHVKDSNILYAVILKRYCPGLLEFPFEGKRSIARETILEAEKICEQYPFKNKNLEKIMVSRTYEKSVTNKLYNKWSSFSGDTAIKQYFDADAFKNFFIANFSQEIYDYAKKHAESEKYFPLRQVYQALATEKALMATVNNNGVFADLIPFQNPKVIRQNESYQRNHLNEFQNILHRARIDVKNIGEGNNVDIVTDHKIKRHDTPKWYSKNGIGHVLEEDGNHLSAFLNCNGNGKLEIVLRGIDCQREGKRLPIFIDYTNCIINGNEYLNEPVAVSHDASYRIIIPCKNNQQIKVEIRWDMHGYSNIELKNLFDLFV